MKYVSLNLFSGGCLLWLALLLASCRNTDPTTGTTVVSGQVVEYHSRSLTQNLCSL